GRRSLRPPPSRAVRRILRVRSPGSEEVGEVVGAARCEHLAVLHDPPEHAVGLEALEVLVRRGDRGRPQVRAQAVENEILRAQGSTSSGMCSATSTWGTSATGGIVALQRAWVWSAWRTTSGSGTAAACAPASPSGS